MNETSSFFSSSSSSSSRGSGAGSGVGGGQASAVKLRTVKGKTRAEALALETRQGGDEGPNPHDGRGCYQCAVRMAARHVSADTTYTNTDLPGHDFTCFGVEEAHVGFQYEKGAKQCEDSCALQRYPTLGRCQAWSFKQRSQPPHMCCLKDGVSDQVPSSHMAAGVLSSQHLVDPSLGHGGLAEMLVGFARPDETRDEAQWRTAVSIKSGKDKKRGNPYFAPTEGQHNSF